MVRELEQAKLEKMGFSAFSKLILKFCQVVKLTVWPNNVNALAQEKKELVVKSAKPANPFCSSVQGLHNLQPFV